MRFWYMRAIHGFMFCNNCSQFIVILWKQPVFCNNSFGVWDCRGWNQNQIPSSRAKFLRQRIEDVRALQESLLKYSQPYTGRNHTWFNNYVFANFLGTVLGNANFTPSKSATKSVLKRKMPIISLNNVEKNMVHLSNGHKPCSHFNTNARMSQLAKLLASE